MKVYNDFDLKGYNSFALSAKAKWFVGIKREEELQELIRLEEFKQAREAGKLLILSGGSNLLLTQDIEGMVVHLDLLGRNAKISDKIELSVGAGENWHDIVSWTIESGWGGFENLALIPGSTGAAPMQNIGAYGVEIGQFISYVRFFHLDKGSFETLSGEECQFGYRESIFKHELKGKAIITEVGFVLNPESNHKTNVEYMHLQNDLIEKGITPEKASIREIYEAVIEIRRSKLPDPKEIGTAGSFFKNPILSNKEFAKLAEIYPDIPSFPVQEGTEKYVKVPAGWLIEQAGFKGMRRGDAGVHKDHALVLVNYGNAKGSEIWALAQEIIAAVEEKFGIELKPEVNIY